MTFDYRLIQFRCSPEPADAGDVALIGWDGRLASFRALEPESKRRDAAVPSFSDLLAPALRADAWVYREWLNRWSETVRLSGGDGARILSDLGRMRVISGGRFTEHEGPPLDAEATAALASLVRGASGETLDRAVDYLFRRLVRDRAGQAWLPFDAAIGRFFALCGLGQAEGFEEDQTIALGKPGEPETFVHFPYILDAMRPIAFKLVPLRKSRWQDAVAAVNDTIYSFDSAVAARLLERDRCLALVDGLEEATAVLIARLSQSATVLDPRADDALAAVHRLRSSG